MTTTRTTEADRKAALARAFADFPRFCGLLSIRTKDGAERLPMRLTALQKTYNEARTYRDIILKPRQVYMTTLEAARDVWWFLTRPGARVVVVCQSQTDQGALKDIAEKFRIFFDSLQRLGLQLEFGRESSTEWSLPKRDATLRIIQAGASESSAGKKGRGGTINRLHMTEAAFFENAETTFNSLLESVPKEGSEIVNESTPNGAAGFFFEQWQSAITGESAYKPHFFPWWWHPEYRIAQQPGEEFIAETELEKRLYAKGVPVECLLWYRWKIASKGGNHRLVAQEYPSDPNSCFLLTGRGFFDGDRIGKLLDQAQPPIRTQTWRQAGSYGRIVNGTEIPQLRVWHAPTLGKRYVLSIDTSRGREDGDSAGGVVYEYGTGRHMATIWGQIKPWEMARIGAAVAKHYNWALIVCERNGDGLSCLRALEVECHYPNVFVDHDGDAGWITSNPSRTSALDAFEEAVRKGHFQTYDAHMLSEMRTFIVNAVGRPEAAKGTHDDLVLAGAIGWDIICRPISTTQSASMPVA